MKLCFSFIGILMLTIAFSQTGKKLDLPFSHLTQADGLAGNKVLFMTQDNQGYIWIYSLFNGLQRYDGVRFQPFGDQFLNKQTNTYEIHELNFSEGHLYVRISDTVYVFDPISQKFIQVDYRDNSEKVSFFEENGNVWKIGRHSFTIQDNKGTVIYKKLFLNDRARLSNLLVYDSVRRNYWVANDTAIFLLDGNTMKVYNSKGSHKHPLFDFLNKKGRYGISNMIIDDEGNFWISIWGGGFFRFNLTTTQFLDYPLSDILKREAPDTRKEPLGVNNFLIDNHNQLWVLTYGAGLLKYNSKTKQFDYLIPEKENHHSLQYNYELYTIIQDGQDNLWVGTDMGISIFNPYKDYFITLRNESNNSRSMPSSEIISAFRSGTNELWVGTWGGGIAVYDSNFSFKKNYRFDQESGNMVWCFAEDKKGRIWAGCQKGWVHRFNPATNKFEAPFLISNNGSTITYATSDNKGNIYFGYYNGNIAKWDASKDSFYLYPHRLIHHGKPVPIQYMIADHKQNILVTNGQYIYQFDTQKLLYTDSISLFTGNPQPNNINLHSSFSIVNDSILLVTSLGGKPGYINVLSKKFEELKIPEEIVRKRITNIEQDQNGRIWLTADQKLYQYIPGTPPRLIDYYFGSDIINTSFSQHNMVRLQNGRRAIWTTTEVVIFDPGQLNPSGIGLIAHTPTVTGFKVFDRYILLDSFLNKVNHVPLSYDQNFVTIEFAPLLYTPFYREKYFYKLSGVNNDWVEADDNFNASYTNLKPGNYLFSVRPESATSEDQITTVNIIIAPPFWQTWWFYSLCTLALLLLIIFLVKRRIKFIRKEAGLRQKVLETEMAALRAQMNPHFIFNCISAIDNLIQNDEKDKATTYLASFAKLIRNVLDSSRNEVISFYKDFETIKIFIELERLRSSNKFDYELKASPELIEGDYKIPPLVIQPFIENAIHHGLRNKSGNNKFLEIAAHIEGDFIIYSITDNGVGRLRAEELNRINRPEHVSYGIRISSDRIKNFNGRKKRELWQPANDDLTITDLFEDKKPAGTRVCLKLKINS